MNKVLRFFIMTTAFLGVTFVSINITSSSVSAACNTGGASGYDSSCNGSQGGGGSACPNNSCGSVVYSGATGVSSFTVGETPPNGYHIAEVCTNASCSGFHYKPAETEISTGQAATGSQYYYNAMYADRSGYVYIDGVRTWKNAGEFITYIPFGGITRADGSVDSMWAAQYSKRDYGTMNYADVVQVYNQMVAAGLLPGLSLDKLQAFGGLANYLKTIENPKEILCQLNCNHDETPPSGGSCHVGTHAGWTEGKVTVNNFTTGTGWTGLVWARPGDTVRFSTYYCWGVGAVGGSAGNDPANPKAIYPGGAATVYGSAVNQVWFQVTASPDNKYLFGYDMKRLGQLGRVVLDNPHNSTIGGASNRVPGDVAGDSLSSDYTFTYLSPSERSEDADSYNCSVFDFGAFTINNSHGYQIPGLGTGGCSAASQTRMNDAGGSFSQTINYSYDTAWQRYRHNESGDCNSTCTWQPAPTRSGEDGSPTYPDRDMNTLIENNTNVQASPYRSLAAALGAGANNWGLIKKWSGDTRVHGTTALGDCNHSGCSANNWRGFPHWGSSCPCSEANYCSWCIDYEDGSAENNWDPPCRRWTSGRNESECGCARYDEPCWGSWYPGRSAESHSSPGKSHYPPEKDYSTGQQQLGSSSSTATVMVPYSYRTALTSTIQEGDVIYTGETVSSLFTASIISRVVTDVRAGEAYATVAPGYVKAVEFVVSKGSTLSKSTGISNNGGGDPCSYYADLGMISGCNTIWEEHGAGGYLNEEGRYGGKTYTSGSVSRVVPDIYPVGSKYCVAVGISTSDSHGQPDTQVVGGMSSPSGWRISNLSCRTIAKKPNFEVWNGGFYTKGSIKTSTTAKRVGANLGDPADPTGYFGSWNEYYVTAKGNVTGFSSGAGLGYYGGYNSNSLGLQGGTSPGKSFCDLSRMTIANDDCASEAYGKHFAGNSMIEDSATTLIERIRSRYTSSESSSIIRHLDNGATYIYSKGSTSTQALQSIPVAAGDSLGNTILTNNYIMQTRGSLNTQSEQTTNNYASNALVIHVSGDLTINTNICAGDGTCKNLDNTLMLGSRNSGVYTNIYSVPQVLIIADGNIIISDAVTQIDAWLITNGNINTCNGLNFYSGNYSASTCGRQLIVNGPVFANSLTLARNSGADPGAGSGNNIYDHSGNPIYYNLTDDGSVQPAEIFNLRPDVLFWAYSQAQRYSQANVTYTRELAPRY